MTGERPPDPRLSAVGDDRQREQRGGDLTPEREEVQDDSHWVREAENASEKNGDEPQGSTMAPNKKKP